MDELDDKILEKLNENARKSYREIARELNVSLTTVANRIKKLEDGKIIERYIPLINQEKIGYDLTAVYDITGEWDSLIIAHFKDRKDLNGFIKGVLSMDNVEKTNTQLVLNIVKNEKRVMK